MSTESFKRKLSAILSADVVGYSRLMNADENSTVKTISTYREIMAFLIKQHRGRIVDSPGDNILAEFASVVDATQCALAVQKELQSRNSELPKARRMVFRIGINLGDVIEEGNRIYGDGVNIAARLETLCDPEGICISKTAFDQIESKLPLGYEYMGEQSVKNIAKPVEAYRILMEPRVMSAEGVEKKKTTEAALMENMAYPLPEKPSIAVLPFTNLSGDPTQEYIGDGISENIISALSKIGDMFVIAYDSTSKYKEKPKRVKDVAEGFGVQYVLKGSVQKSGDRIRVTAQLIDALNGHHLWSDKYDRKMAEFFDLQDEITKKIVLSLQENLTRGEEALVESRDTENLEALSNVSKGYNLLMTRKSKECLQARALFEEAIRLDPNYAAAWVWLGMYHLFDLMMGWSKSPNDTMKHMQDAAEKASTIGGQHPQVLVFQGVLLLGQGQYDVALSKGKEACSINPNYTGAYCLLERTLYLLGLFEESIEMNKKAMRLSPYYAAEWLIRLGNCYFFLNRYDEAIEVFKQYVDRCRKGEGPTWYAHILLAKVYVELGKTEQARVLIDKALKLNPKLSLENLEEMPFKNPAHRQRLIDVYRKVGVPEKAKGAIQS